MDTYTDTTRQKQGFITASRLIERVGHENTLLDPMSLLISEGVTVGKGNTFYPGVVIERTNEGSLTIGNDNIFYPGTFIVSSVGIVQIGDSNEFGPAGVTIKSNTADATIVIGSGGRYCDGVSIMGKTTLGDGSQVLGNVMIQNCSLGSGGTFQEPDPDKRGAVLKGFGLARGVTLEMGQVVNGAGNFAHSQVEWQRAYHPKEVSRLKGIV